MAQAAVVETETTQVLIVGGGPCGLMLANELGRRGIAAILVDQKASTAFSPQANATQARTMEHFRRLGIAKEIRRLGLPDGYPTDIAYFTRYTTHELGRVNFPSARKARQTVKKLGGSWSAAELPHRVSQKFVEAVLFRHAADLPSVSLNYSWQLTAFNDTGTGVDACLRSTQGNAERCIQAEYLVGVDGPRSFVRQQLGIHCPSSDDLRRFRRFRNGGSGPSGLKFMLPAADAASGGWRVSCA